MRRPSLPLQLGTAFSVSAAREAGVTASRLRAADLRRPFHGVRARAVPMEPIDEGEAEARLLRNAHEYDQRMPESQFLCGVTAAVAWKIPLPYRVVAGRPLDVGVLSPRRNPAGAGVRGHEIHPRLVDVVVEPRSGLRMTSPASTWAMLGAVLADPYDLIAAGDHVLRQPHHPDDPPALAVLSELESIVAAGRRVGVPALRAALPRVCTGADSRPETWARLILIDAGVPAPVVNPDVFRDGVWIARVDLAWPEQRVVVEYEGVHHLLDPEQWARDIARIERLVAAGWRVIRVTKEEIFQRPHELVARVRQALAAAERRRA